MPTSDSAAKVLELHRMVWLQILRDVLFMDHSDAEALASNAAC